MNRLPYRGGWEGKGNNGSEANPVEGRLERRIQDFDSIRYTIIPG
jgi:hypothetical protein